MCEKRWPLRGPVLNPRITDNACLPVGRDNDYRLRKRLSLLFGLFAHPNRGNKAQYSHLLSVGRMLHWISKVRTAYKDRYRMGYKRVLLLLWLEVAMGLALVFFLMILLKIFL